MATNTITTKGVLIINGKQVDNTFYKLMGTVKKLDRELKKLPEGSKEFAEKAKQLKFARKAFNKVKNEIARFNWVENEGVVFNEKGKFCVWQVVYHLGKIVKKDVNNI